MSISKDFLGQIKKLCGNDENCFFVASVFIGIMLCYLFKDRISGFSDFDSVGLEPNINLDAAPPTQELGLKGDKPIGIELKKRKPDPTPSTQRNLEVMGKKPVLAGPPIKQSTGLLVQDAMIFKPFDEVWNPGFMPLDMVFNNVQKEVRGPITGPMGPDRPMGPGPSPGPGPGPGPSPGPGGKEVNIVLLYAPWCGHSKKMLPDFEKVKSEYDGKVINGSKVNIIMYDSDVDKDKIKEYGVKGFPTLFVEKDGQREPFPHRSYDKISDYLTNL